MSEQYRCNSCGYIFDMSEMMCSVCGNGRLKLLRWTKGGDGSHWEGCAEVHWDCKIAHLEKELERRDEIIARLKEDGERLVEISLLAMYGVTNDGEEYYRCSHCGTSHCNAYDIEHGGDCPITLHRALMKELEC